MINPVYNLKDMADCIRLVRSTAPMKNLAEAMLAVIDRLPGAPSKEEVIAEMKRQKEERGKDGKIKP